jgi:O-antigen ligase
LPTLLLPPASQGGAPALAGARARSGAATPRATLRDRLALGRSTVLRAWRPVVEVGLGVLALAVLFGRVPLPGGLDFGYRSAARNVAILFLAGALAGAPGVRLARSRIAWALLGLALAATASVLLTGGRTAAVSALWVADGVFHAVRAVAADAHGRRRLLHGVGLLCVAVLARELWNEPSLLHLRETYRHALVTEHPNTLGFAMALVLPVLLAATARRRERAAASAYAIAAGAVVLVSFSRAAWLAMAASTLALALATRPSRHPTAVERAAARAARVRVELAAVAALLLLLAVVVLSRSRIGGDAQRLRILDTAWSLFLEHRLFGVGFGSGNLERLFTVRHLERHGESLFLFHSHDLYVDLLTGSGVVGAVAALALFVAVGRTAWRGFATARHRTARAEAAGHATSFGAFLLLGLVDTPLYHGRVLLLSVVLWAMLDAFADCAVPPHEPKKAASPQRPAAENARAAVRRKRHRVC